VRSEGALTGWAAVVGAGDDAAFRRFVERIRATSVSFDTNSKMLSLSPPDRETLTLFYAGELTVGGEPRPFIHDQPVPILTYDSTTAGDGDHPFYA
ncbi:hypothetical protein MOV61_11105, partial [Neorhizobium sp. BETTINA12A]|nr:hypothetical protein [Neorhizobium sp. BETTINA12A]